MNEAYKDVRRLKMTLKTLEITWVEACCPPYTDANKNDNIVVVLTVGEIVMKQL